MDNILSVLILNRNSSDDIINIYNDLKKQTFQDFHLIVIDDNSCKNELSKLLHVKDDRFITYNYPSPWTFGVDNKWSMGLKKANITGSKYTYSIQTDMKINSIDLLEKLVLYMENNSDCAAACPTIFDSNGIMNWGTGIEKIRMGSKYNINETYITRNKVMEEIGFINDKLVFYGSEFYFINCIKILGYYTTPLEGISVSHFSGGTSSKYEFFKDYYRPRTTILLIKLFHNNETLKKRLIYLYEETSEPRDRIVKFFKQFKLISLLKSTNMFLFGLIAGLLIPIKLDSKNNYIDL